MKKLMFFGLIFSMTLMFTLTNGRVTATYGYHGVILGVTQDSVSSYIPGTVQAYTAFYPWGGGSYGWTGVDFVQHQARTRTWGGSIIDISTSTCGNPYSNAYNCTGPMNDVFIQQPGPGQWVVTEHGYDNNYPADSDRVAFYSAHKLPLGATRYYFHNA